MPTSDPATDFREAQLFPHSRRPRRQPRPRRRWRRSSRSWVGETRSSSTRSAARRSSDLQNPVWAGRARTSCPIVDRKREYPGALGSKRGTRASGFRGARVLQHSNRRRYSSPGFPGPSYDRTWLNPAFSSKKKTTKHTNDTKKKRRKENLLVVSRSVGVARARNRKRHHSYFRVFRVFRVFRGSWLDPTFSSKKKTTKHTKDTKKEKKKTCLSFRVL